MAWAIEDKELFEIIQSELQKEYLFREKKAKQEESQFWEKKAKDIMVALDAIEELRKRTLKR
jgi:hypothetical protein